MLATLYSLGSLATIALAAFGIGRPALRALRIGGDGELAAIAWSISLGFVISGWLLSMAAFAGGLTTLFVGLLTGVGLVSGLGELACVYLAVRNPLRVRVATSDDLTNASQLPSPSHRLKVSVSFAMIIVLAATWTCALAPPVSTTVISESLDLPKTILLQGSIHGVQSAVTPRPQFAGMLYAWGQMLDGPVTASLLNWLFGILLAAATGLFARMFIGREWAWIAAAMTLSAPGVLYQMHAPLDDLMAATFATLALVAWWKGAIELQSPRWFVLAGLFLGAALATKAALIAMLLAVAVVFLLRATTSRRDSADISRGAVRALYCAFPVAAPWWIWSIAEGGVLAPPEMQTNVLVELGPLLLAAVPGLAIVRKLRGLNVVLTILVCFVVISRLVVPQARSFAAMAPLLAMMATWLLLELPHLPRLPGRLIAGSMAACGIVIVALAAYSVMDAAPVACGCVSRDDYLRHKLPAYAAAEVANCVMREHDCLLSNDPCRAYFKCRVAPVQTPLLLANGATGPTDDQRGVTHVLLRSTEPSDTAPLSSCSQGKLFELCGYDEQRTLPLTDYITTSATGERVHYRLLILR
jgi:hypothetical protein